MKTARVVTIRKPSAGRAANPAGLADLRGAVRCPVLGQAIRAQQAAAALGRVLGKLRRAVRRCERCAYASEDGCAPACPLPGYWNAAIDAAIRAAAEEWGREV